MDWPLCLPELPPWAPLSEPGPPSCPVLSLMRSTGCVLSCFLSVRAGLPQGRDGVAPRTYQRPTLAGWGTSVLTAELALPAVSKTAGAEAQGAGQLASLFPSADLGLKYSPQAPSLQGCWSPPPRKSLEALTHPVDSCTLVSAYWVPTVCRCLLIGCLLYADACAAGAGCLWGLPPQLCSWGGMWEVEGQGRPWPPHPRGPVLFPVLSQMRAALQ